MLALQDKLVHWLMREERWVSKGEITKLTWKDDRGYDYLPETVGRKLREAEQNKRIAVKPDERNKSVVYKWLPHHLRPKYVPTTERDDPLKLFK